MKDVKQRNRRRRQCRRSQDHKRSVLAISAVVLLLTVMVSANSMTLKNREYQAQETELKEQIQAEKDRSKEIKELDKYVGTDKYVEDVAKEKLGLVHNNEIIFKAK